jgi:hypothetical protein
MLGKYVCSNTQATECVTQFLGAPVQIGIGNNVIFMKNELCDLVMFFSLLLLVD